MESLRWNQRVRNSRQTWFIAALGCLAFLLSVQYGMKAVDDRSAILRWRPQIQQIDTLDIYEHYAYPNPPIMAILLKPFVSLPPLIGSLGWFYAKIAMTIVAFVWVFRLVEAPGQPLPFWAKGGIVLLSAKPVIGDLAHGNVNLFILFLVVAALYAYRDGRDWLAGLALALAIACKVTPALFVPYFLWKRSFKTLGGCVLGLALFLVIVPGLFLGMERNLQLLAGWFDCMVRPFVFDGQVTTEHINQSLPGLLYRLGTHSPSFYEKGVPIEYSNLVSIDPRGIGLAIKMCMAAFAALVVWSCRTPTEPRRSWRLAAEYGVVICGMLLFSERTWKHHCVTLVVPFAALVYYGSVVGAGARVRAYVLATLAGAAALMASTAPGPGRWSHLAKLAEVGGAYVWVYVLLAGALVYVLRREQVSHFPPLVISPYSDKFSTTKKS